MRLVSQANEEAVYGEEKGLAEKEGIKGGLGGKQELEEAWEKGIYAL